MSRVHEEAEELLDNLLRCRPNDRPPSLKDIDDAFERIEELSKLAQSDEDEAYLDAAGETLLQLRASSVAKGR